MEQTIDIRKVNEELQVLKMEFAKMKEDLEFARRTEEAWERYDKGEFKSMSGEEFLKELKKW